MPRDGSGVHSWPAGTDAVSAGVISSAAYNAFLADLLTDLNAARPITAGGTGQITAALAFAALEQAASATATGTAELATNSETLTGTDAARVTTPDGVAALWEQGADIASADPLVVGDGGYFHITGTTGITDIDFTDDKAGREVVLVFDGILTLTHHATTLILPGGANIVTAAGDMAVVVSEGSDAVRMVAFKRAVVATERSDLGLGAVALLATVGRADMTASFGTIILQRLRSTNATYTSLATQTVYDDTIPPVAEGTQVFSQAITPVSASSVIKARATLYIGAGGSARDLAASIHKDGAAAAQTAAGWVNGSNNMAVVVLDYEENATDTTARTFTIRAGGASGTVNLNGNGGGRKYGGVLTSVFEVWEELAL